jgi:hypothetical protein
MPKQMSALNTFWLIEYLGEKDPDINPEEILAKVKGVENVYPVYWGFGVYGVPHGVTRMGTS